ncbi:MAG: hypothetical protein V1822_03505 [Candidatus Micrarchaeota archaeon]
MMSIKCTKCNEEIDDFKQMVQIIEDAGYTATYCGKCGEDVREKMRERDESIL